ncbi:membrane-spanning 4-domains subfamily A member 4D-like [Pseudophryne corroboree]|uniref:membrane-spanning 4-domains subfamily A member 4D-like n=1 Tax=Pseudophryne corroboree TaxID=495146 RepID=UPI0030820506
MSAADTGSFVVISQVGQKTQHANGAEEGMNSDAAVPLPKPLVTFYKGEPEALGVTQIFVGIIMITFGLVLTISGQSRFHSLDIVIYSGVLFWTGIMYICSGSLSVAASAKPTVGKVRSSLVLNILSSVVAGVAMIMMSISYPTLFIYHYYYRPYVFCAYYTPSQDCVGEYDYKVFLQGILAILLILHILIFTINISTSVFACRTVCRSSFTEMNVVIYQTTSLSAPNTTAASTDGDIKIQG